jgi:hypothetical protein
MLLAYAAAVATGVSLFLYLEFSGAPAPRLAGKNVSAGETTRSRPAVTAAPVSHSGAVVQKLALDRDDPVRRYRAGRTAAERLEALNDFMALGHDKNVLMLAEAVRDSDPAVRMFAIQSAASLTPGQGIEVYRQGAVSADVEVRSMTWSLVGPHPEEGRAAVYREALQKGGRHAVEEALQQMTSQPGKTLFEMMLQQAASSSSANASRLLQELRAWLVPGGGKVPAFQNVSDMKNWWAATSRSYDSFMLRMDQ